MNGHSLQAFHSSSNSRNTIGVKKNPLEQRAMNVDIYREETIRTFDAGTKNQSLNHLATSPTKLKITKYLSFD